MVEDSASRRRRRTAAIAQAYRDSHEIMSAAMSIAIFAGGGYWLDTRYGCKPALTICGACLGSVMAVLSIRRLLTRLDQQFRRGRGQHTDNRETHQE
ncbi:MAG: AtpZ/AtpI family protein [Fuerstiella sp.]|nr:AtpZ/AtpI family protein [Fuerstiella sp.]MCP4784556.1 AtpZ/AtpI family protein [Fuerstiella sp.]MCP4854993.1 AtpZ/AtpI family protein [Fuerstiella sp.]